MVLIDAKTHTSSRTTSKGYITMDLSIPALDSGSITERDCFGDCAIIITTRDRYSDLTETLDKLLTLGLWEIPLYIVDDASAGPIADPKRLDRFSNVAIYRNEEPKGLIVNRNYLAKVATQKILISLDDDSCFDGTPDFKKLSAYIIAEETICGVEFDNLEMVGGERSSTPDGRIVQMYTGFGHAVHRDRFVNIGGYREYLFHMCEERDLGQRAWRAGLLIRKYRAVRVIHRRSSIARVHERNLFYFIRNTIFMRIANTGIYGVIWSVPAIVAMLTFWGPGRGQRRLVLRALKDCFSLVRKHSSEFQPMTFAQWKAFRRLPPN